MNELKLHFLGSENILEYSLTMQYQRPTDIYDVYPRLLSLIYGIRCTCYRLVSLCNYIIVNENVDRGTVLATVSALI